VVIFDIDGTLVDSVGLIVASYQYAFRTVYGHEWDEAEIKTWIGLSLRGVMDEHFPADADRLFALYTEWVEPHAAECIRAYPGIPALIADLLAAGVRVGGATSKRRDQAEVSLTLGDLTSLIPTLVAHEDVDAHKPDPAPLLLAVERAGGTPGRSVYVGDAVVDLQAAHAAGMDAVGVTWGAGVRTALAAAGPVALADTVADLRAVLLP